MAYALPGVRAFYPDGAWWTPCLMECSDRLLQQAEAMGIDASFCPVRAMLPAFENGEHFPRPDLLICSTGAVCDDFSAIAQRLEHLGHSDFVVGNAAPPPAGSGETALRVAGQSGRAAESRWTVCATELQRVGQALGELAGTTAGRRAAWRRASARRIKSAPAAGRIAADRLFRARARRCPRWKCSSRKCSRFISAPTARKPSPCLRTCWPRRKRASGKTNFVIGADAVRIFWVNPVADLRAMNLLEELGGRICGSDYMFTHALDLIPEDLPPLEALARTALADPMVGSDGRPRRAHRPRMPGRPRRGGGRLAHSRRQPLRPRGGNHPRNRAAKNWNSRQSNLKSRRSVMPCCRPSARGCRRWLKSRGPGEQNDLRRHRRGFAFHQGGVVRHRTRREFSPPAWPTRAWNRNGWRRNFLKNS